MNLGYTASEHLVDAHLKVYLYVIAQWCQVASLFCQMDCIMTGLLCSTLTLSCLQALAVALYNPEAFRALGQLRMDVGRVLPERMTDEAYRQLLVTPSN